MQLSMHKDLKLVYCTNVSCKGLFEVENTKNVLVLVVGTHRQICSHILTCYCVDCTIIALLRFLMVSPY